MIESENIDERFSRFIENFGKDDNPKSSKYELELSKIALEGERSLIVDFNDLYSYDQNLAVKTISEPDRILPILNSIVLEKIKIRNPAFISNNGTIIHFFIGSSNFACKISLAVILCLTLCFYYWKHL